MDIREQIISQIRTNRISTTEVADVLGKKGVLQNVYPINRGFHKVGNVFWIYTCLETNWPVHEQIQEVKPGDVILIEPFECGERAIVGDLVAKYALLYKQAEAMVITGRMRDVPRLIKENWPIWCDGYSPVGCFNREVEHDKQKYMALGKKYEGAIAVCDDCGVVIIPGESVSQELLEKLKFIEEQEDIWYYNLDKNKMSTYEIVCLKKYLES